MQQIIYKVPNGKLLKIFIEKNDNKIADIKITGDFFIYPEEKISMIEERLKGARLDETELLSRLNQVIEEESLELFGVDAESIVTAIFL